MIEIVSPARTLRFKGETTAEHRLWSDSLHKLCNSPKAALSKLSIEEEKRCKLETEAGEVKILARQREQERERERVVDSKRAKESSEAAASARGGAEKKHSEQKQKHDEQPEEDRARERSRQPQQQPSDTRGDRRVETGSRSRNASPPRRRRSRSHSRSRRSRSRSDSGSGGDRRGRRKGGGAQDGDDTSGNDDDDDEPRSRTQPTVRQTVKSERNADVASPRERSQTEREGPSTARSRRDSSGYEHERRRSPPRNARRRSSSGSDDEEQDRDPRGKRSARQPSEHKRSRNESERDQSSDEDDDGSGDDNDIRGGRTPAPAAAATNGNTAQRASLLVSQIKSASPRVPDSADPKVQRGASPVPPVAVQLASAQSNPTRVDKEEREDDGDDSDSDEDPQEESPREPTPRAATHESPAKLKSSREQRHSEHSEDENESKDAGEEEKPCAAAPPVQPKKKMQETEYFDGDDDEEEEDQDDADSSRGAKLSSTLRPGADRRVSNSNQAALAAHETGSRQERLKSGGNGAIARDNNFVEEDWDAEDEQEAAQAPVSKNAGGVIENPAKVRTYICTTSRWMLNAAFIARSPVSPSEPITHLLFVPCNR